MNKEIEFGVKAKDKISGFQGIVIGKAQYLTGCDQVCLKPSVDKEGKMQDAHWFDEGAIEEVSEALKPKDVQSKRPGGPRNDQPKK